MTQSALAAEATTTKKGLQIGQPVAIGRHTGNRLLTLAAASAPVGSADPVDQALQAAARRQFDKPVPTATVEQIEPATPERRYSVVHLSNVNYPDGGHADRLLVYRGDLEAIMTDVKTNREDKFTLRRNAQPVYRAGYRPLGVASAEGTPDGKYGQLKIAGFVPLRTVAAGEPGGMVPGVAQAVEYLRLPTWSVALRVMHWMNVALILILSLTGIYIMNPFFGDAPGGGGGGHLMGWVRLIHFVAVGVWVAMSFVRVVMLFFSMNPLQRWPALWPLKNKHDLTNAWKVIKAYLFIDRHEAPVYVGHNPLQQVAYTGVYLMAVLQVVTGFALFAQYHMTSAFWRLMAWPSNFLSVPDLRLWHTAIMYLFWVFLVLHIYLAIRADSLERHGGLSSMVNGGIWLKKGTVTADDPRTYEAK